MSKAPTVRQYSNSCSPEAVLRAAMELLECCRTQQCSLDEYLDSRISDPLMRRRLSNLAFTFFRRRRAVERALDRCCSKAPEKKLADLFFNKDVFPTHYEIYAEAIALLILIELCHVEREDYLFELPKATHSADTVEAILGYIRDNVSSANLENTARHFGYSPVHLSRIIKKHTGSSFAKFILLQRMVAAEHLLSKTDMPIREIAASTGLESPEYFSRIFKKYNDVSPMQYRKEHR